MNGGFGGFSTQKPVGLRLKHHQSYILSEVATVVHCLCQVSCLHTTMSAASFTFAGCRNELSTSGLVSLVTNMAFGEVNFLPRNLFPIGKEEHHVMCPITSDPPILDLHSVRP